MKTTPTDPRIVLAFVAVAETLSFSKAAVGLGVTKGTISRRLARLEQDVGGALVSRSTHRVTLTQSGRELYERARDPVRALAALTADLPREDTSLFGEIRLTAPPDLGVAILPEVLDRFMLLHPGVTFDIQLTNEELDLVDRGLDLAIRVSLGRLVSSSLIVRRIGETFVGLYASPEYVARRGLPRAFGDPDHDWLGFTSVRTPRSAARGAHDPLRAPKGFAPRLRTNDLFLVRELARCGRGVAGLPTYLAEPLQQTGELLSVLPTRQLPVAKIFFVTSRRRMARRVEAFRDHLIKNLSGTVARRRP